MTKFIFIPTLLLMALTLSSCAIFEDGQEMADSIRNNINEISAEELKVKIDAFEDFLLIDVRQASDFQHASITGSFNIPRGVLEFKIRDDDFWEAEFFYTPEDHDEIVLYCARGTRSALAAHALQQLGFSNVLNLKGGIITWDPALDQNQPTQQASGGCGD